MKKIKLVTILVLAILTAIVVLQNLQPVDTRILFATISMPRAVLLVITWLIGLVCGVLLPLQVKPK